MKPPAKGLVKIETQLRFRALCIGLRFSLCLLDRSFEGAQATHFIENSFIVHLALEALERTINGFTLFNNDFWHIFPPFLEVLSQQKYVFAGPPSGTDDVSKREHVKALVMSRCDWP